MTAALPGWLEPLHDSSEQRELDRWAIEDLGMGSLPLMERAGAGLARLVTDRSPSGRVVVVIGKGNNGGDGLVAARLLRGLGRHVDVLATSELGDLSPDARANLGRLPGEAPAPFDPARLEGASVVVDALLGTGFSGEPRGAVAGAIAAINALEGALIVACDVPSGVDASTGAVEGEAVVASATATFHTAKPGLWIAPGKQHAGAVRVFDIGIPASETPVSARAGLIHWSVLDGIPRRSAGSTKFSAGSVLITGGSPGLTGAPSLAAEAAMRAGAGYVTACVPASLNTIFELRLLEVMTVPLPDEAGVLRPEAADRVLALSRRADALVLGPGLGRTPFAVDFARYVAQLVERPLVIDADGLNAHGGGLARLDSRPSETVLTPHEGELGRLLDRPSAEIKARRLTCAREAAAASGAVVVLKGDDTLVARPDGLAAISRGGAPALATAGTGDVLSGVIGALLAKGLDAFTAACAGVYLHVSAGRLAAGALGADGVIASDVIAQLPRALAA